MRPLLFLLAGLLVGAVAAMLLRPGPGGGERAAAGDGPAKREPLYWVAPMDSSYRRDGPGKSPMGMDLVPVYAGDAGGQEGLVSIAPEVVNNLGVRTDVVRERGLREAVSSVGYVGYDEEQVLHVHPRVSGWVEKLHVKTVGEQVQAGAPLYALYSPQLVSAQEELVLAVERGVPDLIAAARERLRALQIPDGLIEQLARGGRVAQTVTFTAPRGGVLEMLEIREGFYVEPNMTLISIAPLHPVWVEVELFESQMAQIDEGLPVTMTVPAFPERQWQGEVDYIYPALDPRLRTLRLRLRFDNGDHRLRPNMFAQVEIETPELYFLAVPEEAVIRLGDGDRVVREEKPGAYRSVPVHLGRRVAGYREVLHGLASGDRVVTSAQFLLDSESSKSAELMRMQPPADDSDSMSARDGHAMHEMSGHAGHEMAEGEPDAHAMHDMSGHAGHEMAEDEPDAHAMHDMSEVAPDANAMPDMSEHAGHDMMQGGQQHD